MIGTLSRLAAAAGFGLVAGACRSTPPAAAAAAEAPCAITPLVAAETAWRAVTRAQFTMCVPARWRVAERRAHLGTTSIAWGEGTPRGGPLSIGAARRPDGPDTRRFFEDIDRRTAQLYLIRSGTRYFTGAQWTTPAAWITGSASTPEAANLQLTIYRTVRFRQ